MIKNLLALSAFLVIVFAVVGWYLNWYRIETTTTSDGRRTIQIDLNNPKISEDLKEGKKKLHKILASDDDKQQQPDPKPAPNQNNAQQKPGGFWYDDDSTFVYPQNPQGEIQQTGFRRVYGPPRPEEWAPAPTTVPTLPPAPPPNTLPPLPPAPSVPPPGFPVR